MGSLPTESPNQTQALESFPAPSLTQGTAGPWKPTSNVHVISAVRDLRDLMFLCPSYVQIPGSAVL